MPYPFQLTDCPGGFALHDSAPGGTVEILTRELIGPGDSTHLVDRLERLHGTIFGQIPGLPAPSTIDHLLVIINKDLSGVAYANELAIVPKVQVTRNVTAGEQVRRGDVKDVVSVKLGVDAPSSAGVVLVQSIGWKKSLYFDLVPFATDGLHREVPLEDAARAQLQLLLGVGPSAPSTNPGPSLERDRMSTGLNELRDLLRTECQDEAAYQGLLERHPWMFGTQYTVVDPHTKLDDEQIPDFTAVRTYDGCRDLIELKQPFLPLFKASGAFNSNFNDAWNQAERYVAFVLTQRGYLQQQKNLLFDNPRCLLLLGHHLTVDQLRQVRAKEGLVQAISVLTYDQLVRGAEQVLELVRAAHETIPSGWLTQR